MSYIGTSITSYNKPDLVNVDRLGSRSEPVKITIVTRSKSFIKQRL